MASVLDGQYQYSVKATEKTVYHQEKQTQFFHILGSVNQQRGCCEVADGKYEITIYTSCCNADKGIYYYTTYDNHSINGIDMHHENLDSAELIRFAVPDAGGIHWQN